MTESELRYYINELSDWDKDSLCIIVFSSASELVKQQLIFELKKKAVNENHWLSSEEFDNLYQTTIEKAIENTHKRILNTFTPFTPFTDMDVNQLPAFPIDSLPPVLKDYVLAVAENKQVSPDMVAVSCLAVVALSVQGKFEVLPLNGWKESLNLYTIVIAPPSERKSPVLREVTAPVYEYEDRENRRRAPEVDKFRSQEKMLVTAISKIEDELSKNISGRKETFNPSAKEKQRIDEEYLFSQQDNLRELRKSAVYPLRLIADDVTPEKLIEIMNENNGKVSIISAEGGIFDIIAGRYSDRPNMDIFLKAYPGDPVKVDRKGGTCVSIECPSLTILLMAQPMVLSSIMENKDFKGKGLLARFFYCIPNSLVGKRKYRAAPIPESIEATYKDLIFSLLSIPDTDKPLIIPYSPEADLLTEKFYNEIEPRLTEDLEEIGEWAGKLHGNSMRIAALLHCCQHLNKSADIPMAAKTIHDARLIGLYFLEHAKAAFSIMGMGESQEEKDAKYILKRMEKIEEDYTTVRDVFRLCHKKEGFKTMEEFRPKLDILVDHGYIFIEPTTTNGRPTEKIYINPEYRRLNAQN